MTSSGRSLIPLVNLVARQGRPPYYYYSCSSIHNKPLSSSSSAISRHLGSLRVSPDPQGLAVPLPHDPAGLCLGYDPDHDGRRPFADDRAVGGTRLDVSSRRTVAILGVVSCRAIFSLSPAISGGVYRETFLSPAILGVVGFGPFFFLIEGGKNIV
jgi:hypothetical protein